MSGTVVETGDAALHLNFRPRARILQLLGDELIGSPRLAVFELVKNAYDADAETVRVVLNNIDRVDASIVVEDDGDGMTLETIRDIWLVPGHDHRARQRKASKRTRLNRLPLGEKGVGRFAAHKLGNRIELITRATEGPERVVSIDWAALTRHQDLSDAVVHVGARESGRVRAHPYRYARSPFRICARKCGLVTRCVACSARLLPWLHLSPAGRIVFKRRWKRPATRLGWLILQT